MSLSFNPTFENYSGWQTSISNAADDLGYYQIVLWKDDQLLHFQVQFLNQENLLPNQVHLLSIHFVNALIKNEMVQEKFSEGADIRLSWKAANAWQQGALKVEESVNDQWQEIEIIRSHDSLDTALEMIGQGYHQIKSSQDQVKMSNFDELIHDKSYCFEYDHKVLGEKFGKEKAELFPVIESYIHSAQSLIQSLKASFKDLEDDNENSLDNHDLLQEQFIQYQIDYLDRTIQKARVYQANSKDGLIDSNYYRTLLSEQKKQVQEKKAGPLVQKDWDKIHQKVADQYIPFITNCWNQTTRVGGPNSTSTDYTWMRFGAFYDSRCALFSMKDFMNPDGKFIDNDIFQANGEKLVEEFKNHFYSQKNNLDHSSPVKKEQSDLATQGALNYALSRICNQNNQFDKAKMLQWLAERKIIAQTSFLSLLESQVQQLKSGASSLKWAHLSLVKPHEHKIQGHDGGWTHSEKYEVEELKWAFDHFRGATIIFDADKTSSIDYDPQGKPLTIHLRSSLIKDKSFEPLKLESYLVSTSVASTGVSRKGHKDDEAQLKQENLNKDFFSSDIKPKPQSVHQSSFDKLERGESDFYTAEDMGYELLKDNWQLSLCCQSGKDRTGYVCSRLAQRLILDKLEHDHSLGKISTIGYYNAKLTLNSRPLDHDRVTKQILRSNTGFEAIKVGVWDLPGYDLANFKRIGHYVDLAVDFTGIRKLGKKIGSYAVNRFRL
jgi:hypothetical protein